MRTKKRINIKWFNPSFNKNKCTNIGKIFLKQTDKYFPKTYRLHLIFNRNDVKVKNSRTNDMEM